MQSAAIGAEPDGAVGADDQCAQEIGDNAARHLHLRPFAAVIISGTVLRADPEVAFMIKGHTLNRILRQAIFISENTETGFAEISKIGLELAGLGITTAGCQQQYEDRLNSDGGATHHYLYPKDLIDYPWPRE